MQGIETHLNEGLISMLTVLIKHALCLASCTGYMGMDNVNA